MRRSGAAPGPPAAGRRGAGRGCRFRSRAGGEEVGQPLGQGLGRLGAGLGGAHQGGALVEPDLELRDGSTGNRQIAGGVVLGGLGRQMGIGWARVGVR